MERMQMINLGDVYRDVEGIKRARTQNKLADLALQNEPQRIQNQNRLAELAIQGKEQGNQMGTVELTAAERAQAAQEAKLFLNTLGSDYAQLDPQQQQQRWMAARQQQIQLAPEEEGQIPQQFDPVFMQKIQGMAQQATSTAGNDYQFGAQETFKDSEGNLFFGTTKRNAQTGQMDTILSPVGGGAAQPVGRVQMVGGYGLTGPEKVEQLRDETLAKRGAEAAIDLQTKPQIAAATTKATEAAKAAVESAQGQRSNATAYTAYTAGIKSLADALGSTTTGPVAGMLPAFSDEARIADGAIAAMAPILKQMFRSAGEGTFTDSDQKLLMDMIPTRQDGPAVQRAKFSNIDSIVRAKLGVNDDGSPTSPPQQDSDEDVMDWSDL